MQMEKESHIRQSKNENWIFFIAGRFNAVDSRGRSAMTSLLSVLGIAFGVTALIVILSVMNGFQMGYIQSILEVSSYHLRATGSPEDIEMIKTIPGVRSVAVFSEIQSLMQSPYGDQQGVLLRALDPDILQTDSGFSDSVVVVAGSFDLHSPYTAVLGYELARMLSVEPGDTVSILAVSGTADTDLFPENATLTVAGLFRTGYYEIDSTFSFISRKTGIQFSGVQPVCTAGIKIDTIDRDRQITQRIIQRIPNVTVQSWRSYNKAFFGALKIEKNILFMLVVLIFLVVTVNIYNGMRRSIYERRDEIGVLTALGARQLEIRSIFVFNGLAIGLSGGMLGLLTGLLLSVRINDLFLLAECIVNGLNTFIAALSGLPNNGTFTLFSPDYFYMLEIPVRILFPEILFVWIFGVLSAAAASWFASKTITGLKPAEVLRYE